MKFQRLPTDFVVQEQTALQPTAGQHALYRLDKQSLGTLEVVAAIARRWNLSRASIAIGGLKDRHAVTSQRISIEHGPPRNLQQENFSLVYLGQIPRPYHASDILANRFQITLRDLRPADRAPLDDRLAAIYRDALPNYFDDQRFGSLGPSREFVARPWCAGDWERTVWLAIAEENPRDRPGVRQAKQLLREHWGRWSACTPAAAHPDAQAALDFLRRRPTDYHGAVARLRQDLRSLYLAAFQSYLFNRVLAAFWAEQLPATQRLEVSLDAGPVTFPWQLSPAQRAEFATVELPLPSARQHLEPGPVHDLVDRTLAEEGLALRELRVKYPRDSFFSKGFRAVLVEPAGLAHTWADDDLYPGQLKLQLAFELPRGAYATLVVKRLAAE